MRRTGGKGRKHGSSPASIRREESCSNHSIMTSRTERCEFKGCTKTFTFENTAEYVTLLQTHMAAVHPAANQRTSRRAKKAKRLELAADTSEEDWSYFVSRFDQYKRTCGLQDDKTIVDQLLECCSDSVCQDHHRMYSGLGQQN